MTDAPRPNILMILADDHAAKAISAYGSRVNQTPHIDRIARDGTLLEHCYCTNSICAPSRASILTGTYSHINGVTTLKSEFDATQTTFVSILHDAGYRTGIVGKWHLGHGEGHDPQAFDHWEILRGQGEYFDPVLLTENGEETVPGYVTDIVTDRAMQWVDSLDGDAPWCLLLNHKAPHRAWEVDEKHKNMYSDPIPLPTTFFDDYSTRASAPRRSRIRIADNMTFDDFKMAPPEDLTYEDLAVWKYQRFMEDYLRCVASVDDNVGRVLDWLTERGELANTIVIYTSDQGFFLGEHGYHDKRFMYDESIRMPFLISLPGTIPAGASLPSIVTNVDIAQTLLDAADLPADPRMQGHSFWPQLTGSDEPTQDAFYYRYFMNNDVNSGVAAHYGIRTEHYKLIYFYGAGLGHPGVAIRDLAPEWELYDLTVDPHELHNVYHNPRYTKIRDELKAKLATMQADVKDVPYDVEEPLAGAHRRRYENYLF